jgi:hypothetical protein
MYRYRIRYRLLHNCNTVQGHGFCEKGKTEIKIVSEEMKFIRTVKGYIREDRISDREIRKKRHNWNLG